MTDHPVVTLDQWLAARRRLLDHEKELTRLRDRLAAERRAMPWLRIEKDYRFDGPEGPNLTLLELFRPPPSARRLSLHVRARLGAPLQELLVLGRRL